MNIEIPMLLGSPADDSEVSKNTENIRLPNADKAHIAMMIAFTVLNSAIFDFFKNISLTP